jgi:dihydroxyacetone kinase
VNAGFVLLFLQRALVLFRAKEQELGRLDAAAGDGDHGTTMVRGLGAAVAAVEAQAQGTAGERLVWAGDAFADAAGGASGALFGALLSTVGRKLLASEACLAEASPSEARVAEAKEVVAALGAGAAAVAKLGKAAPGDKTLLDALVPFVEELGAGVEGGMDLAGAWHAALPSAQAGAAATAGMMARRGRAARLRERSVGCVDPGAQSVVYLLGVVDEVLQERMQFYP